MDENSFDAVFSQVARELGDTQLKIDAAEAELKKLVQRRQTLIATVNGLMMIGEERGLLTTNDERQQSLPVPQIAETAENSPLSIARGDRMGLADAVDFVLNSAAAPMSSKDILTALGGMASRLARPVPKYHSLRSHLSTYREERGWVLEGRGHSARWRKGTPTADPAPTTDPKEIAA